MKTKSLIQVGIVSVGVLLLAACGPKKPEVEEKTSEAKEKLEEAAKAAGEAAKASASWRAAPKA